MVEIGRDGFLRSEGAALKTGWLCWARFLGGRGLLLKWGLEYLLISLFEFRWSGHHDGTVELFFQSTSVKIRCRI